MHITSCCGQNCLVFPASQHLTGMAAPPAASSVPPAGDHVLCLMMLHHATTSCSRTALTSIELFPLCSPARKMFRFQCGDAASPIAGPPVESPYATAQGRDSSLGSPLMSPKRAQRKIARSPFKVCVFLLPLHVGTLKYSGAFLSLLHMSLGETLGTQQCHVWRSCVISCFADPRVAWHRCWMHHNCRMTFT